MSLHPVSAECPTCFGIIPLRSSDIKRDWHCKCDDLAKQVEREIKFTIEMQRRVAMTDDSFAGLAHRNPAKAIIYLSIEVSALRQQMDLLMEHIAETQPEQDAEFIRGEKP